MSSRGPPLLGMARNQKFKQWQQDVRPWLPAILTACLLNLLLITGVIKLQTNLTMLMEPQHPEATPVQSLNYGSGYRRNLVIAVVGDTSMHPRWMELFQEASWDLAVIYIGNQTQFTCPDCVHVELNKGAKWLLVYGFTQSVAWHTDYQHRYQTVYVPDDDILQTGRIINSIFDIHQRHNLLVSQPVLCSWLESHTASWDMVKKSTTVLRYTNFVEIMVPVFSMTVFNSTVIDTMSHAETGWGLDWLWPFLLGYPQDKIAIMDEVCVVHPKAQLQPPTKASMYSNVGSPGAEEWGQYDRFGYDADSAKNHGMVIQVAKRLGQLWQPWYQGMIEQAGLQVDSNYVPSEREVKLIANASLHVHHVEQSLAAMQIRSPDNTLKPNLVIVTGQPLWYTSNTIPHTTALHTMVYKFPANYNTFWDLIIIQDVNASVNCPACLLTFVTTAVSRFQQLWQLTQSKPWKQLDHDQYQYVYLPDGDTYHEVKQIERMFEMMSQYELLLAHPSLCSDLESQSLQTDMLKQQPVNVLRYTTAVDVLAPVFDMAFFQDSVVRTLQNATFGHGLQWLWPFLLGYAPRKTAILDEVCIVHPHNHMQHLLKTDLQARMQHQIQVQRPRVAARSLRLRLRLSTSTTAQQQLSSEIPVEALMAAPGRDFLHVDAPGPVLARMEARLLLKQYSYKAELYGVQDRSMETVEAVLQPWYQILLDMGSIQVSAVRSWHQLAVRKPDNALHLSKSISHPFTDMSVLRHD